MARGRRSVVARILNPNRVDRSRNGLTASGARVKKTRDSAPSAGDTRATAQKGQPFFYYDNVGAIKQAAQFYARGLSPLELFAAEWKTNPESGKREIVRTEDPTAIAVLERMQDPGGGRTNLLATYGRLMFLVGEAFLFVSKPDPEQPEQWEMLSTDELRQAPAADGGTSYERHKRPNTAGERYTEPGDEEWEPIDDSSAIAYRLWKRHPRYSDWPDAPMQGVIETAEELLLLTQAVRARVRSRLAAAGILFIDASVSPANPEPGADEDPEEDPFIADLTEAMTRPIEDEGAASAVVPLVVRVAPGDDRKLSDLVHHLQLYDHTQIYPEFGMRDETIKRLAVELDMPVEALLGLQNSNHWSAWMVDEQTWKGHLQPIAQQLVEDLSAAFYRPTLKAEGVANPEKYLIAYDESKVVTNPDRGKDAKEVHDRGALADEALRRYNGFDESDAPSEDERRMYASIKARDPKFALTGEATPQPPQLAPDGGPPDTEDGAPAEEAPAEPGAVASANGNEPDHIPAAWRIVGAADVALLRAREAAGNRLRSLAKRDPELRELLEGVPTGQIACALGPERVRRLKTSERDLVAGSRPLIADAFRLYGLDPALAARVCDFVEQHAARTLYEERPRDLPPQLRSYVEGITRA